MTGRCADAAYTDTVLNPPIPQNSTIMHRMIRIQLFLQFLFIISSRPFAILFYCKNMSHISSAADKMKGLLQKSLCTYSATAPSPCIFLI